MMYTIPYYLVVYSCSYTSSYGENKLPIKGLFQQRKNLIALDIVGKVSCSSCWWIADITAFSRLHVVVNDYRPDLRETIAFKELINLPGHVTLRLVSDHLTVDH